MLSLFFFTGKICSVPELMPQTSVSPSTSTEVSDSGGGTSDTKSSYDSEKDKDEEDAETKGDRTPKPMIPKMVPKPGTEIRFCKFPHRPYREGATPSEITHCSLDSSYSVGKIIDSLGR